MKVKELIALLKQAPKNMEVYIPATETFDGFFKTPCEGETGITELGLDENDDSKTEEVFVIAPHGFFEEEILEDDFIPELN